MSTLQSLESFQRCSELDFQAKTFLNSKRNPQTRRFYECKIHVFIRWLAEQGIESLEEITPSVIRAFFVYLEEDHSQGGRRAYSRGIKHFLRWTRAEFDIEDWKPLKNVTPPKKTYQPLPTTDTETVRRLIATCRNGQGWDFTNARDEAIFRFLADSGCRAGEFLALNLGDIDLVQGSIELRAETTKTKQARITHVGNKTLLAVRRYLKARRDHDFTNMAARYGVLPKADLREEYPLWLTVTGIRMSYQSLRKMLEHRLERAGVEERVTLHSFRKYCATSMLKSGASLETIRRILGHNSLAVTQRYLRLSNDDIAESHKTHSPGDRLL